MSCNATHIRRTGNRAHDGVKDPPRSSPSYGMNILHDLCARMPCRSFLVLKDYEASDGLIDCIPQQGSHTRHASHLSRLLWRTGMLNFKLDLL